MSLCGPTYWCEDDEELETLAEDFRCAPLASLQVLSTHDAQAWTTDEALEWSDEKLDALMSFWDLSQEHLLSCWSPSLAQAMPPKLTSLALAPFDTNAFDGSDWIIALPRTLTNFTLSIAQNCNVDFVHYAASLPPKLITLALHNYEWYTNDPFGDWNDIEVSNNVWPSTLRTLVMKNFWIEESAITNLPSTIERLHIAISASDEAPKPIVETSKLPPNLTSLNLEWTKHVELDLDLTKFNLKTLALSRKDRESSSLYDDAILDTSRLPKSLTTICLDYISITAPNNKVLKLPPKLVRLHAYEMHIDLFKHLPRSLQYFELGYLRGIPDSPLLAEGHLFKHLPASIRHFHVKDAAIDVRNVFPEFKLGTQRFDHLPFLRSLDLSCAPKVSSKIFRNLPRSLAHLSLDRLLLHESDLPFLPPRLESFNTHNITPSMIDHMSLRSLAGLETHDFLLQELARKRIREASVHQ